VYLVACDLLRVEPGPDVIVLEDSPTGVAAGVAAGLTVIGVPSLEGVELDEAHHVCGSLADPDLYLRLGL
jgi:beta-phosphoglucomutase-like phosphatase (HAD superfamily)